RFTYARHGLCRLLDLGEWWEGRFAVPLPLGAIAARRDLDRETALAVQEAIRASLRYADEHPEASREFVRRHAQEMDPAVTADHIKTFVTEYSLDLGKQGREAIELLVGRAVARAGGTLPATGLFL
ncbi:MAG: 1,4-dihydroxy-6-naphthoate synthase, partial [Desulfovibrionaceae bacterium]|nr:1,4-dihydroxy-6-naphthoate synthase [Desulfovibrionaceae bacterium]